jgi:Recombination endonuclease VII
MSEIHFVMVEIYFVIVRQELCGKWMPRKRTTCARTPGHKPPCMTAENLASRTAYRRNHPQTQSPESRKRSNRKYRISLYGLTQEQFDRLLEVQGHTCAMCHEPFDEGQQIDVDHDHACCRERNRSCGKCGRGLPCHGCNIALGHIEHRYGLARAYLDSPAGQLVLRAACAEITGEVTQQDPLG